MDVPAPEGEPPYVEHEPSRGSGGDGFHLILAEIQALQFKLVEVYEAETKPSAPTLQKKGTFGRKLSIEDAATPVTKKHSAKSRGSRGSRGSPSDEGTGTKRMAANARATTHNLEKILRHDEEQHIFQLNLEWDMDDEVLLQMEKTHVATSPRKETTDTKRLRSQTDRPPKGCAMNPSSPKRMVWDVLAMVALLIEVLTAPLQVYNIGEVRHVLDVLHWSTTSYWVLDVPASFLTGVYIDDVLDTRLLIVAKVYLKRWFWFDLLMLAPEALALLTSGEEDASASGLVRLLRARRLVRVVRFVRIMRFRKAMLMVKKLSCYRPFRLWFQGRVSSSLLPILLLMLGLMFSVHFLAALWFVAGDSEEGWVFMENLNDAQFVQQYVRSVEWAVSRLPASSLRSNMELKTMVERWLAILATFVALVVSSLFVSVLTNIMADVARRTRKMTQILESVRKYCGTCGVSAAHTNRIKTLVEREHSRASIQDHMQFLLTLPEFLVRELFHEARSMTLSCHPFFLEIGSANPTMELQLCNHAVQELYLIENDMIFHANQKGMGLYILASGHAKYWPGSEFFHPQNGPPTKRRTSYELKLLRSPGMNLGHHTSRFLNLFHPATLNSDEVEHEVELPPRKVTSLQSVSIGYDVPNEEHVSEHSLWIRGWKHQGRLEATVESRALHVGKSNLRHVLQDYYEILATAVVYARSFVAELNQISPEKISDMPVDTSRILSQRNQKHYRLKQVAPDLS